MDQTRVRSSYRVSPNIALIKYWGKYDEDLILPLNSSFSLTLSEEDLYTETEVIYSPEFKADALVLNGKEDKITQRLRNVIDYYIERSQYPLELNGKSYTREELKDWHFSIVSRNSFPTAAGLASSSSGIACLVLCLKDIFNFKETYPGQISEIARIGSGSASRSIYGGAVEWKGVNSELFFQEMISEEERKKLSPSCIATQIFPPEKFDDLEVLVLVSRSEKKDVPSTGGMNLTARTSELFKHRVKHVVEGRLENIKKAMEANDWSTVFEITMRDSNNFHSVCLDTYPPIFYLNSTSNTIIKLISKINEAFGENKLAYTFDAGPNAVLFIHKKYFNDIARFFIRIANISLEKIDQKITQGRKEIIDGDFEHPELKKLFESHKDLVTDLAIESLLSTKIGKGPVKLN